MHYNDDERANFFEIIDRDTSESVRFTDIEETMIQAEIMIAQRVPSVLHARYMRSMSTGKVVDMDGVLVEQDVDGRFDFLRVIAAVYAPSILIKLFHLPADLTLRC